MSRLVCSLAALSLFAGANTGCVSRERPIYEADERQTVPIPVCAKPLPPPRRNKGEGNKLIIRDLEPEEWLEIMMPEYRPSKGLEPRLRDCTGNYAFANEVLRYGVPLDDWPVKINPDDLDMRQGPRGLRVLRLRVLAFENGDVGGPIALMRAVNDKAEVYAVGSYRGPSDAKLTPMRLGNDTIVVAEAKRCPDVFNCRKVADFYLARRGRLVNAASVDLERVVRVPSVTERGLYAEYHLTTDVSYSADGVQLLEQLKVRIIPYENQGDRDSDRVLRTVEFARLLRVERDTLFSTNEPLWERVVGQD
jgi:hypothetical protein